MNIIPLTRSGVNPTEGNDAPRVPSREPASPQDEAELVRRLAHSDVAALTAIADWLWEPLAAYAYRIVEDRDTATDIAQEACVWLWERRGRSLQKSNPGGWPRPPRSRRHARPQGISRGRVYPPP